MRDRGQGAGIKVGQLWPEASSMFIGKGIFLFFICSPSLSLLLSTAQIFECLDLFIMKCVMFNLKTDEKEKSLFEMLAYIKENQTNTKKRFLLECVWSLE